MLSSQQRSGVETWPAAVTDAGPMLVVVQRDWNGWRKALAPLATLDEVHWRQPPGAPRPLVHAYVSCRSLLSGDLEHGCCGQSAHRLLVCVLRKHAVPSLYEALVRRAEQAIRQRS